MKRKYIRKVSPEIIQLKSDGFRYSDLPVRLRKQIDSIVEGRKGLNLFDDTVERKERALRYHIWRNK